MPGGPDAVPQFRPEYMRFSLRYAASAIHRWGIYPNEPIPARRRVIRYTGERINQKEVRRRLVRPNLYLFVISPRYTIDGAVGGSGAEYINHSCEPNLWANVKRGQIWLVSLRPIAAGEELLLDYRISSEAAPVPCHCGAPSCRGFINLYRSEAEAAGPGAPVAGEAEAP